MNVSCVSMKDVSNSEQITKKMPILKLSRTNYPKMVKKISGGRANSPNKIVFETFNYINFLSAHYLQLNHHYNPNNTSALDIGNSLSILKFSSTTIN